MVKDCSELERMGFTASGAYFVDPSGNRDAGNLRQVYCHQGWTYVLRRQQGDDIDPDLFANKTMITFLVGLGDPENEEFFSGLPLLHE